MTQVAYFVPTVWKVEKFVASKWEHVGNYGALEEALRTAQDIAQTYNLHARVLERQK